MASAALAPGWARLREESIWLYPVTLMALGLFGLAQLLGAQFGLYPGSMLVLYGWKALRMLPSVLIIAAAAQLAWAVRESPRAPTSAFLRRGRALFEDPALIVARFAPLLLMPVVFVGFSALKMLMPRFLPFSLDDAFAGADRILFLGYQPWELTHAVFGSVEATYFLDRLYSWWVLLLSIAIVTVALFASRTLRARFFIAFTLAWVLLGVCGAWLLASAGPCFSAGIGADSAPEFTGLMERLAAMSIATDGTINAPGWQQVLWRSHAGESYGFGMGISAMPSLHNAIATLYALAAFRVSRAFGWVATVYAVLIFIGSVHLGWHYAVDGIVGALAMVAIWKWTDRWCRRSGYDAAAGAA
jgi:hypothetical protein